MSPTDASIQRACNRFTGKYLRGIKPLDVDNERGPLTNSRIMLCKFYLGYGQTRDASVKRAFLDRLAHPRSPRFFGPRMLATAFTRRRKQRAGHAARPLAGRALHVAQTLIGVMEQGGNNTGPMVSKIIRENGGDGPEPWCGDFVAYCYRHAGSKIVQRGWAAVRLLGRLTGMSFVASPQPGDIVTFVFDHTALFEKDLGNGYIQTIEGNTGPSGAVSDSATGGDGVYRKRRSKAQVARYVRVHR